MKHTKHIRQIIIEGLKFFFDIEPSVCHHSIITAHMIIGVMILFFRKTIFALNERLADIREDVISLKNQMIFFNERRNPIR